MIWHQQISSRKEGAESFSLPGKVKLVRKRAGENNPLDVCYLPIPLRVNITGGGILISHWVP